MRDDGSEHRTVPQRWIWAFWRSPGGPTPSHQLLGLEIVKEPPASATSPPSWLVLRRSAAAVLAAPGFASFAEGNRGDDQPGDGVHPPPSERGVGAEAHERSCHWEGDLVIGLKRSAIGTLVERTTRFTMLIHLPRELGYGEQPRKKNGPALAGYGAVTMKNRLAASMTTLPEQLRRSLTWDRGKELSAHAEFTVETDIPVFFADPKSPWQRGTNENANGLLRQYFPKGTDLTRWSAQDLEAVAAALNARPRKILDWRTPAEAFDEHLRSLQQVGVATTD